MAEISESRVPETISKDLAQVLERQIIFGELAPDTRLTEEDLVDKFNVSRSPVREALRVLKQDGLITIASRRGARVSPISVRDLDEVFMCRIPLEALAAQQAAVNRTEDDIRQMRDAVENLRDVLPRNDPRGFFEANVLLSDVIHHSTNQATLMRLLSSIGKQALRYRYLAYLRAPILMDKSVDFSVDIVEAIIQQRPRHAQALTEDVLENSWKNVRIEIGTLQADSADQIAAYSQGNRRARKN